MKTIKKYNGSSRLQNWDRNDNIHAQPQVWIDGVVTDNPFYFTIDKLAVIDGIDLVPGSKNLKWGQSHWVDIVYNGDTIHSINCGHSISDYVAKITNSKSVKLSYDVSDGILADVDVKFLTDFRKAAVIKPYDYNKISDVLGLISLNSHDYTGGMVSYPDNIPQPVGKCFL